MKYVLTPEQMTACDNFAISELKIPSLVLMENAARSAAIYIRDILEDFPFKLLILCGSGNNGGDGFALARHLFEHYEVTVAWVGSVDKMSEETRANFDILQSIGISSVLLEDTDDVDAFNFDYDCLIDAMIGVGAIDHLRGVVVDILKKIKDADSIKIAIDVPTGLNSLTGNIDKYAFKAHHTVTMYAVKAGMLRNQGVDTSGIITIADLGAPNSIIEDHAKIAVLEQDDIFNFIPERQRESSKFDYGKVLIIAGSRSMPGAAALCSNAALRSGAGLVYLYSTTFHSALYPEVIRHFANNDLKLDLNDFDDIMEQIEKCDSIVIGPGMGNDAKTLDLISKIIYNTPRNKYLLIDADGLKGIDKEKQLSPNIIITPHIGEFAEIIGIDREKISTEAHEYANIWAKKLNCTVLLKHYPTVISNGEYSYWNIYGNPGMASAGSGDVLSGCIAGIVTIIGDTFTSGAVGTYIHSKAGDLALTESSSESLLASDIINNFDKVLKRK